MHLMPPQVTTLSNSLKHPSPPIYVSKPIPICILSSDGDDEENEVDVLFLFPATIYIYMKFLQQDNRGSKRNCADRISETPRVTSHRRSKREGEICKTLKAWFRGVLGQLDVVLSEISRHPWDWSCASRESSPEIHLRVGADLFVYVSPSDLADCL